MPPSAGTPPPRPPRFPLSETAGGAEAKQTIEAALNAMHANGPPFPWQEDDGSALLGCYAPLSYSPSVTRQFFEVAKSIYTTDVKPRNRELATLGLASLLNAPYIAFCHRDVAAKVGLSPDQHRDAMAGKLPEGLNPEEQLAYRLGRILTQLNGPLDDATFAEVRASGMAKEEFVGIVHTIAGYRWIALLDQVNADSRWG